MRVLGNLKLRGTEGGRERKGGDGGREGGGGTDEGHRVKQQATSRNKIDSEYRASEKQNIPGRMALARLGRPTVRCGSPSCQQQSVTSFIHNSLEYFSHYGTFYVRSA